MASPTQYGHATRWDGEANVTESLEELGSDVMRAVFVANNGHLVK
jgi:hypothetical protein